MKYKVVKKDNTYYYSIYYFEFHIIHNFFLLIWDLLLSKKFKIPPEPKTLGILITIRAWHKISSHVNHFPISRESCMLGFLFAIFAFFGHDQEVHFVNWKTYNIVQNYMSQTIMLFFFFSSHESLSIYSNIISYSN